ncbi:UNVERIFIED_CONTAM: Histone-binding protein MSI1 [Sesamum angustifolium]|uniref:Histone-binding protein MSI1 n=1 Tax=Sesamum angustifolium TaxID=2727405 RepID=A0AAW2QBK4_9LAMI
MRGEIEERLINEEYKIGRRTRPPFLYDLIFTTMRWSAACHVETVYGSGWGEDTQKSAGRERTYSVQKMKFGDTNHCGTRAQHLFNAWRPPR